MMSPAYEKIQSFRFEELLASVKGAANLAQVGGQIGRYLVEAAAGKILIKDPVARRDYFIRNVSKYSREALKLMNFQVEAVNLDRQLLQNQNFLMVSNHMSYIDILVMSSIQPSVFVTSVDMASVFFLGTMAEMGGSLFIERRHRGQIQEDVKMISETLRQGFHVVIYPEGTSSNGQELLPFKRSLLMSAFEAGRDILPICLKYTEINGEPFGPQNADLVCWYGGMSFGPHFANLAKIKNVRAEVHFLEPIEVTPECTRAELAEKCYQSISSVYNRRY